MLPFRCTSTGNLQTPVRYLTLFLHLPVICGHDCFWGLPLVPSFWPSPCSSNNARHGTMRTNCSFRSHNMVFTHGPLSLGELSGDERQLLRKHFTPMETAAHPRFLFKPRSFGMMFMTLTSSASLWTGVVKTFRCATYRDGRSDTNRIVD